MITLTYRDNEKIKITSNIKDILNVSKSDFLWLDAIKISEQEKLEFFTKFDIKLQLPKKKRIRHSFRFIEKGDKLIINTRLLLNEGNSIIGKPVTFILEDDFLISFHNISHLSFSEVYADIKDTDNTDLNGKNIILRIFEKILEFDIDLIESVTSNIVKLGKKITIKENLDEDLIYEITDLQEMLILIRRNIIDKQRVILSIFKNEKFSKKVLQKRLTIIEKDIHSILDYISFDFERLEYLQNTLMGIINLRQNVIMKIFTIVSVIFLPPTLIASIYGMNFQNMPELNFPNAYPIAISVMAIVSLIALFYFKRKKWI